MSSSSSKSPGFAAGSFSFHNLFKLNPSAVNDSLIESCPWLVDPRKLSSVRAYSKEMARLQKQRKFSEVVELFNEMDSRGIKPLFGGLVHLFVASVGTNSVTF
jgi:pentatricopeptide repeat protein